MIIINRVDSMRGNPKELNSEYQQLLSIFDSIDEIVYVSDPDTCEILYINGATRKTFGDVIGQKCYQAFQNLNEPCSFCTNDQIFGEKTGQTYIWEFQNRVNNRWYRCIDKAIRWPDGRWVRYEMAIDVNERIIAEKSLKESEEKYRTLFEASPEGIVIISLDGTILDCNSSAMKISGSRKEEIIGKHFTQLNLIKEDDIPRLTELLSLLLSVENIGIIELEIIIDKETKWIEVFPSVMKKDNQIYAIQIIVRDITGRRQAEEDLKKAKRELEKTVSLYTATLESTGNGILAVDSKGKTMNFNQKFADMWNIPKSTLESEDFSLLTISQDHVKNPEDFIAKINELSSQPDAVSNFFIECNDGRILRVYTQPMYSGEISTGRVWSFHDVTERKKMEGALIQLNEVLRLMNKNLRHDILNDLTAVNSSIEIYNETKDENLLKAAFKSVEKSISLIERMRELETLVTSGGGLKPYSAREVVEGVIKRHKAKINVKGDCTIVADDAFVSVIDNIIGNAETHGNADKIDIEIDSKADFCEIRIADNGTGIPDKIKDEIFEEGFSGDGRGTGLGLYIVRRTIERYGGDICVENNEPRGTIFIITLKAVSDYYGIRSSLGIPVSGYKPIVHSTSKVKKTRMKDLKESSKSEEIELDLRGLKCPQPILKLNSKAIKLAKGSVIRATADCPTFERDLRIWAAKTGNTVLECLEKNGLWSAHIIT